MDRRPKRSLPGFRHQVPGWLVLIALLVALAVRYLGDEPTAQVDPAEPQRTYLVARVVDGDTLLLEGRERVRLLGVDTPESVAPDRPVEPLGPEASQFTKRLVEGRHVRLGFDKERKDRYGRTLAYVYVGDRLLNEELIRAGFSKVELRHPYSNAMKRRFRAAEDEAREANRGLWSLDSSPLPRITPGASPLSEAYEKPS